MEGPSWATGCYKCSFGLVDAPSIERQTPSYHARLGQFQRGELTFCDCQAGQVYHKYLVNMRNKLIEEAKQDPMMGHAAAKETHPELERAYGRREGGWWSGDDE